jgi:O-antigen/teichoic acid export membrane protein
MSIIARPMKFISGLLSDKGLTKKAYLNALTVVLEYGASLLVGFLVTPLMVVGLGNYLFGLWQVLVRLIGYLTPTSGRPAFALKATLVNQQASTDYDQKRRYVGSSIIIWLLFLPFLIGLGGTVTWFVPYWVHAPAAYVWIVRAVSGLLVFNTIFDALSSVPQVTLQGENLGYKRMGMSVLLIFVGGALTWLALYLKTGIVGVAVVGVVLTFGRGLFYFGIVKTYSPWFGMSKPQLAETRQMLGLSLWFMGWNLVTSLLLSGDVVVLGLLNSVDSVTNYSLTKYVPETLIGVIVIIVFGIMPGLGSIVGTGDYGRAIRLRDEINSFIWLVATVFGASVLIWNRVFIGLWVGTNHFAGSIPNLLIIVAATQLAFIRSDGNVIDLTLRMSQKVLLGLLSVTVSVVAASILVGYFKLGIVGLCSGIIGGRLIMSIGYPVLIGRFLNVSLSSQINRMFRPILVASLIFLAAMGVDRFGSIMVGTGIKGWLIFILSAGATGIVMSLISFYSGLSGDQRRSMIRRVQAVITTAESS